jgi:hypothetical protein
MFFSRLISTAEWGLLLYRTLAQHLLPVANTGVQLARFVINSSEQGVHYDSDLLAYAHPLVHEVILCPNLLPLCTLHVFSNEMFLCPMVFMYLYACDPLNPQLSPMFHTFFAYYIEPFCFINVCNVMWYIDMQPRIPCNVYIEYRKRHHKGDLSFRVIALFLRSFFALLCVLNCVSCLYSFMVPFPFFKGLFHFTFYFGLCECTIEFRGAIPCSISKVRWTLNSPVRIA